MSLAGQRLDADRYRVIPRTLSFLTRANEVLLLRLPESRGAWAGLYNGIGGHLEPGEDPLSGARREIREETGLEPETLSLSGVALIDTGQRTGIALYVFRGHCGAGEPTPGPEGTAAWFNIAHLDALPLVEDLPSILPHVLRPPGGAAPFSAIYRYDTHGRLSIHFGR